MPEARKKELWERSKAGESQSYIARALEKPPGSLHGRKVGGFAMVVCAESLREVEQTTNARHPGSSIRIAFPIEPECYFAGGPHIGA